MGVSSSRRTGTVTSDTVARALARRLGEDRLPPPRRHRMAELSAGPRRRLRLAPLPSRTPYFCSGCPHNVSTRASDDQLVGLGIGCHIMAAFDEHGRGHHVGLTQMGGEGAQWIGLAPFAGGRHYIQNLGDGTFFHSGSLAVRAAVAAGVDITYRLLYNGAVAMTGGQEPLGRMAVPELTRLLAIEGVRKVVVTTPEPEQYREGHPRPGGRGAPPRRPSRGDGRAGEGGWCDRRNPRRPVRGRGAAAPPPGEALRAS